MGLRLSAQARREVIVKAGCRRLWKVLYAISAFPREVKAMRILTQVTPALALMAIRCRAYSNLFLNLTEEGNGGTDKIYYSASLANMFPAMRY